MLYSFDLVIMVACAVLYYRIGEHEYEGGYILAAASVCLWMVGSYVLHWGRFGCLLIQAALFLGLTFYNMYRSTRK